MKKHLPTVLYFILMALWVMACTKEVGLFTEVEFEVTEEHTGEGFIGQPLPTNITVIPEAEIEGYLYAFTYKITSGEGRFETIDAKSFGEGEKIPLNPFSASVMYVASEKGKHTIAITAEDNFGISQELMLNYTITDVPVTWTATSTLEQVELGKSIEVVLTLDNGDSAPDITYESAYTISEDKGALVSLPDSTPIELGEYKPLVPSISTVLFTPSALGEIALNFSLRDSNGQELVATLPILVVGDVPVISIDLGEHDEIEMLVNETLECPISFVPENATDKDITWVSSDPAIVRGDGAGNFTALREGNATITATSVSNPEAIATVVVSVNAAAPVPVTSITIVQVGSTDVATRQLAVSILPENATDINVTWFSDDTDVVTIDQNGLLMGQSAGKATITATSVSDPEVSGSAQIEISGASLLSANDIVSFALNGQIETATIDFEQHTISVTVPEETSSNVAPVVLSVSEGASVAPGILQARNFALPVEYTVTAGNGAQQVWTVNVTVLVSNVGNEAPTAVDDNRATLVDNAISFDPRSNDSDPENDTLTITDVGPVTPAGSGTVEFDGQSVTFSPAAGISQDASFIYTINDGNGNGATATVNVAVGTAPDTTAPELILNGGNMMLAVGDTYDEPGATANDNVDGLISDTISITGTVDTNTPATYIIRYNVTDAAGNAAEEVTRNVIVTAGIPANRPPTAVNDIRETSVGAAIGFDPRVNDTDSETDALTITAVGPVTPAGSGTVDFDGQSVTFTPAAGSTQAATFSYTINDGNIGNDATANISVNITAAPNNPPTADDFSINVIENSTNNSIDLSTYINDSDPGDVLLLSISTAASSGTASVAGNTTIIYTPNTDYNGADRIDYTVGDGNGGRATATITIDIASGNTTPTADDFSVNVEEDSNNNPIDLSPHIADQDTGDVLTVTINSQPTNGTASVSGATIRYTPDPGFNLGDSIGYTVTDGQDANASGIITITINTNINNAPIANDDDFQVAENGILNRGVFTNNGNGPDSDRDLDGIAVDQVNNNISNVGNPLNGSSGGRFTISANGDLNFNTNGDFEDLENTESRDTSVTYRISDGNGGTDTATVTVTVTGVSPANNPPTADNFTLTVAENENVSFSILTLGNVQDTDNDALTVSIASQATKGTVSQVSANGYVYTPRANETGPDSFVYGVDDGKGGTVEARVDITITEAPNNSPTADNFTLTVVENENVSFSILTLGNVQDTDNDALTVSIASQATKGMVTQVALDGYVYFPGANETGPDSFVYRVDDGNGGTVEATVGIRITPGENRPPVANDDFITVSNTRARIISNRANDSDPDGDQLEMTANFTQPSSGSIELASGTASAFLYRPVDGFVGNVFFTYEITDGELTDTARVTLRVRNPSGVKGSCPDPTDASDPDCPCGANTPIPICR